MKGKIFSAVRTAIYWCSLVAPICDVIKATWTAICNIVVAEHEKKQQWQFDKDAKETDYDNPVYVSLKSIADVGIYSNKKEVE